MKYEHIIWDFNGTILDDVETGIVSVNKLLFERGLKTIDDKEEYRKHFRFPIIEYYREIGFDFSIEPYEVIAPIWLEQYLINVKTAPLYDDIIKSLELFRAHGIKQSIISATEINMLRGQLCELGIDGYFDSVYGLDNIHAASKAAIAEQWRAAYGSERALFIGDTDHDLEVARSIGADCALVCRGHQSKAYLLSIHDKVFDDISQIAVDILQ